MGRFWSTGRVAGYSVERYELFIQENIHTSLGEIVVLSLSAVYINFLKFSEQPARSRGSRSFYNYYLNFSFYTSLFFLCRALILCKNRLSYLCMKCFSNLTSWRNRNSGSCLNTNDLSALVIIAMFLVYRHWRHISFDIQIFQPLNNSMHALFQQPINLWLAH